MKIRRSIELEFDTGCGEVTTKAIVATCLAVAEGHLEQERVRGRVDSYDIRVVRPADPDASDWVAGLSRDERTEWDAFVEHFRRDALVKISGSAATVSLVPSGDDFDAKYALEVGASILLDKPILAVVTPGRTVPRKLREIADKVIEADLDTEAGRETLETGFKQFLAEVGS